MLERTKTTRTDFLIHTVFDHIRYYNDALAKQMAGFLLVRALSPHHSEFNGDERAKANYGYDQYLDQVIKRGYELEAKLTSEELNLAYE